MIEKEEKVKIEITDIEINFLNKDKVYTSLKYDIISYLNNEKISTIDDWCYLDLDKKDLDFLREFFEKKLSEHLDKKD